MTNDQLKIIHIAARQVGLIDDMGAAGGYRTLLRTVGGVETSKQLTNQTFEQVMAVMEGMGFSRWLRIDPYSEKAIRNCEIAASAKRLCLPELIEQATAGRQAVTVGLRPCEIARLRLLVDGQPIAFQTYWQDKVAARGDRVNERMARKIEAMAAESRYELPAMCLRMSDQRTSNVNELTPKEAWNLIEAFKAIIGREEHATLNAQHSTLNTEGKALSTQHPALRTVSPLPRRRNALDPSMVAAARSAEEEDVPF